MRVDELSRVFPSLSVNRIWIFFLKYNVARETAKLLAHKKGEK